MSELERKICVSSHLALLYIISPFHTSTLTVSTGAIQEEGDMSAFIVSQMQDTGNPSHPARREKKATLVERIES